MNEAPEIVKMRDEMETLQRRLDGTRAELQDLLHTISHDFKAPLRAVMSSSMILMEDYAPKLDVTAKDELKRQSTAARHMNRMLEELLKLSRLSRREVKLAEFDVSELFRLVAQRSGLDPLHVRVEAGILVYADRELVGMLLFNLIDNAMKFGQKDKPVQIAFGQDDAGLFVKDEGIGLLPGQSSRVFQAFERLNGDAYPGLGMGLTQAKRIVAMHDGTISIEGAPDEGVKVQFTLGAAP